MPDPFKFSPYQSNLHDNILHDMTTPGDLNLDLVTLAIVLGSHFFLGAYTYQVSSRSENGKGVKIPGHTPYAMEHLYICVAADKN